MIIKGRGGEFSCDAAGQGSGIVTVVAQVTAVVQVRSLAWDLPHAKGKAKIKTNNNNKTGGYPLLHTPAGPETEIDTHTNT